MPSVRTMLESSGAQTVTPAAVRRSADVYASGSGSMGAVIGGKSASHAHRRFQREIGGNRRAQFGTEMAVLSVEREPLSIRCTTVFDVSPQLTSNCHSASAAERRSR